MTQTLAPEQVYATIAARGTNFATVTFIKKDGSIRKINGLFRPTSKIIGSERGEAQGQAMHARGQVPIYSVADREWKSFYADRVVSIS